VDGVADDVSQVELDALCYAWVVLADGATAEMAIWRKNIDEVKLWTEVHTREVNTWCQRQHELWHALTVWAREPGAKERYTEFARIAATKLPKDPRLGCEKEDFEVHREHWEFVAICAEALRDCWDQREVSTEADIHHGNGSLTKNIVANWTEEAYEVWQALAYWARNPLDSWAKDQFDQKSETFE
jgi:hypothetical protein